MQCTEGPLPSRSSEEMKRVLSELNLAELDLDSCEVSAHWKDKLLQIIEKYESVFSRDKMDCGEAKGVVHRINLTDDRPFRFPYRRIPPSQYAKLRTALNEMEEKGIIRKSHSDYASPLVLVWKKNGDLRICTDFRWLNARPVRDAYPLPHQSDVLAALGGNTFFSTMDLTSGYYYVPLAEEYKKYTAFSSPFGLHEYNRLPQSLSNSPATFMRMMMSIFGDENFSSVLCYLDDLMVFAPSEFFREPGSFCGVGSSTGGLSEVMGTVPVISQPQQFSPPLQHSNIVTEQEQDSTLCRIRYYIERCRKPSKKEQARESKSVRRLLKHHDKLVICDGVLYKVKRDPTLNKKLYLFVVPASLKAQVLHGIHDAAGHQGRSRTLSLARQRFFWIEMRKDIDDYVKNCCRCVVCKTSEPNACAPLESIRTSKPLELVCIDFWFAELREGKSVDVLIVTDHFTKMAHAFPCQNQSAKQVAKRLWNDFFLVYGFPKRIHSDQGANFESKLIRELLTMAGVDKSHTTPYHPMDVLLNEDVVDLKDFVSKLKNDLREAARIAQVHTLKEQERHGRLYNRKVKGCPLAVGDRVLVANRGEKGRRKAADKWESSPYEVMIVYPDINVYRIKSINSDKVRVVHRNLLLPEQDQRNDDVNDEIAQRDPVDHDDEIVQGALDHDDRTANWILSNPDGFVEKDGHTYSTDLPDVSDCVSEILDSVSVDAGNLNERSDSKVQRDVERSDENVSSDVNLPEVNGQDSRRTV
ncbi:unnamed protein product [Leuciscus chuanchicus]